LRLALNAIAAIKAFDLGVFLLLAFIVDALAWRPRVSTTFRHDSSGGFVEQQAPCPASATHSEFA
jgi:hypothetical protein